MPDGPAIRVQGLSYRYGERLALDELTFEIPPGEIFGLLGPNGGGKTTLFRILSTLLPVQSGTVELFGCSVRQSPDQVRQLIGVTFQSPSLDLKLSVRENLKYQGMLFGLSGLSLQQRITELTEHLAIRDRLGDQVETLSGGLQRRVEIAKSLLHAPRLLLLDEPSTGLDPGARHDLWRYLLRLRESSGVTILVTTHILDEAENCERLGLLDQGKLVALGRPEELKSQVGGDCITIETSSPDRLQQALEAEWKLSVQRLGQQLRIEQPQGHALVSKLMTAFPDEIRSLSVGRPTLEDLFIHMTGHEFWESDSESQRA